MATSIVTFLHAIDGGGVGVGLGSGHHYSSQPLAGLAYNIAHHSNLSSRSNSSAFLDGGGGQHLSGVTDDQPDDHQADNDTPAYEHHNPQAIVDMLAVFGAILVAAVAIILVTVYFSKLRKRQSSQLASSDTENPDAPATPTASEPSSPIGMLTLRQLDETIAELNENFEKQKPSLWRKKVRSVMLKLRGQEQHKDVYEMPQSMRAQLKQMYVY